MGTTDHPWAKEPTIRRIENDEQWDDAYPGIHGGTLLVTARGFEWLAYAAEDGDWYAVRAPAEASDGGPDEPCVAVGPVRLDTLSYPWEVLDVELARFKLQHLEAAPA